MDCKYSSDAPFYPLDDRLREIIAIAKISSNLVLKPVIFHYERGWTVYSRKLLMSPTGLIKVLFVDQPTYESSADYWCCKLGQIRELVGVVVRGKVDENCYRHFVFPRRTLVEYRVLRIQINGRRRVSVKRQRRLNTFYFENRWDLFQSSDDQKTAPAVPVIPVSPSPVS